MKLRHLLKTPQIRELLHHAALGFSVGFVLAFYELMVHSQIGPLWGRLGASLLAGILGFALIVLVEYLVQRRRPISLPGLGKSIDGVWIYLTSDAVNKRVDGGSIASIWSSGWVFRLQGRWYSREQLAKARSRHDLESVERRGIFSGTGSLGIGNTIHFDYEGWQGGEEDNGAGRYRFVTDGSKLLLHGFFTGLQLGPDGEPATRTLEGRQVKPANGGVGADVDYRQAGVELLKDFEKCLGEV